MIRKTSIRYFLGNPVRALWDDENMKWWFSAVDIIVVLTNSEAPRKYWNALKNRHNELSPFCRQLKMYSDDGKKYLTDVIDEEGISRAVLYVPTKRRIELLKWIKGSLDPLDEQSKKRAYELFDNMLISEEEIGKTKSLQQIHAYLFGGLYDFAGKIRSKNISKGGFVFADCRFLKNTLLRIDAMPEGNLKEIVDKYIEMNVAHPFMEGNGRATRIWLDLILKKNQSVCVNWAKIEKKDYLLAMSQSPTDSSAINDLVKNALTSDINNRDIFMKGIDYSYYYEEIE